MRRLGLVVIALVAAALVAWLTSPSSRISHHRAGLRRSMSLMHSQPEDSRDRFRPRFWVWYLEGFPSPDDRGEAANRHSQALVRLGYFVHREFSLRAPWEPFAPGPEWLNRLAEKAMQEVIASGADWPSIEFVRSPSNTVLVRMTAPVRLVQEWEKVVHDHEGRE